MQTRFVTLFVLVLAAIGAVAQPSGPNSPLFRSAARAAIGNNLDRVAASAGLAPERLEALLAEDEDLGYSAASEMLVYACKGLAVPAGEAGLTRELAAADAADPDAADAFKLHSRPGAAKRILLDFDGHVTTGSRWNADRGIAAISSPAYDTDGNPAAFSAAELKDIVAIWRAVAEDFAPWDVDVTTEDTGASLEGNGVRAVIGGSSQGTFGDGMYGGIAFVNTFGRAAYDPAFVFPEQLAKTAKYIAEATSHEVGHRLGLTHDGVKDPATGQVTAAYFSGVGNWAPIMGASYYKEVTQWSKGEYANANNQQDDTAVISSVLARRADDHGNTAALATPMAAAPLAANAARSLATADGNIEVAGDADAFSFVTEPGLVQVAVSYVPAVGTWKRANADVTVSLVDAAGAVLGTLDTANGLPNGVITATAAARTTLFVIVTGTADAAYTNYGSLGTYKVSVEFPTAAGSNAGGSPQTPTTPNTPTTPTTPPTDGVPTGATGLVLKVKSFKVQGRKRTRINRVVISVTDSTGAAVPKAKIQLTWSHVPEDGSAPAFAATSKVLTTSAAASRSRRGTAVTASPFAPSSKIRLTVTAVTKAGEAASRVFAWDQAASDVTKDFSW